MLHGPGTTISASELDDLSAWVFIRDRRHSFLHLHDCSTPVARPPITFSDAQVVPNIARLHSDDPGGPSGSTNLSAIVRRRRARREDCDLQVDAHAIRRKSRCTLFLETLVAPGPLHAGSFTFKEMRRGILVCEGQVTNSITPADLNPAPRYRRELRCSSTGSPAPVVNQR